MPAEFEPRVFLRRGRFGHSQPDEVWVRHPEEFTPKKYLPNELALATSQFQHVFAWSVGQMLSQGGMSSKEFAHRAGFGLDRWLKVLRGEDLLKGEDFGAVLRVFGPHLAIDETALSGVRPPQAHIVDKPSSPLPPEHGRLFRPPRLPPGAARLEAPGGAAPPAPPASQAVPLTPVVRRRALRALHRALQMARTRSDVAHLATTPDLPSQIDVVGGRSGRATGFLGEDANYLTLVLPGSWETDVYDHGDSLIDGHFVLSVRQRNSSGQPSEVVVVWPLQLRDWDSEIIELGWAHCEVIDPTSKQRSLQLLAVLGE